MDKRMVAAGAAILTLAGAMSAAADPRVLVARPQENEVISLLGARGKTMVIEFPWSVEDGSVFVSEQDVIDAVQAPTPQADPAAPNVTRQPSPKPDEPRLAAGCSTMANLMFCVRMERYLSVMPITDLEPQPLTVITSREKRGGGRENRTWLFEIRTVRPAPPTGDDSPPIQEVPLYRVKVDFPQPVAAETTGARPLTVQRTNRAPRQYTAPIPRVEIPPPLVLNQQYTVQGDKALVGEAR